MGRASSFSDLKHNFSIFCRYLAFALQKAWRYRLMKKIMCKWNQVDPPARTVTKTLNRTKK
jgi:hypothetical protein